MSRVRVKVVGPVDMVPRYESKGAAGADIKAHIEEDLVISPGERILVPTGLVLAIPPGYEGQIRPRSGLALKKGLTVLNSPGTIDADFRGELKILLVNQGEERIVIRPGGRIAQLVIAPVEQALFELVESIETTERGEGGFGSTGG